MAVDWISPLTTPLTDVANSAAAFFPNLIYALILLVIGWIAGTILARIIKELMIRFKVDQYLNKRGPMIRLTDIIPVIFEWAIYLIFIQEAVSQLKLEFVTSVVGVLYSEIPGVIFAVVIAVVGYVLAEYVKKEIQKSRIVYKSLMGNILFWLIVFVSFAIALKQTPIVTDLMDQLILIMVGSIGLGVAIALGLGLKDAVAQVAKDQVRRKKR